MTYATQANMETRFGADEVAVLGTARIAAALTDATLEMDGYLAVRYELPLAAEEAASPLLVRICCDLARYLCYDEVAPERVEDAAKEARRMLVNLARETMVLQTAGGEQADRLTLGETASRPRIFGGKGMEQF